jgi:hypothetical protein
MAVGTMLMSDDSWVPVAVRGRARKIAGSGRLTKERVG